MRIFNTTRSFAALSVLLCAGVSWAGKNPLYESWASHGAGTTVQVKKMMGNAAHTVEMDVTYTLSEVAADKVTVDVKTVMNFGGRTMEVPSQPLVIPAEIDARSGQTGGKPSDGGDAKVGEETLTVDGKSYKCVVVEVNKEEKGSRIHGKAWHCKDVPNMEVKMQATMEGAHAGQDNEELVKIELK